MNLSFYTAAVGAQQQQERLNIHGNNIANVNTFGFKAKKPAFSALMTGPVKGIDKDLPRGVGSRVISAETDFRGAAMNPTGRLLDYAIEGDGFFALVDPATGEISYTRDGSFTKSEYPGTVTNPETGLQEQGSIWYLSDGLGRFVLGTNGAPVEVKDNGEETLEVGIFDFINRNGMQSVGENRFRPIEKNGGVQLGEGKLVQGCLEASGTDLAEELARVIESQRSFSYMLRMVSVSDDIESTVNNLR